MSTKICGRCKGETKKKQPCARRTCRTGLCWQHLRKHDGLRVKKSTISNAGLGLFAERQFKKGERIARYTGDTMTRKQQRERYPDGDSQYVLCAGDKSTSKCVDARRTNSTPARYANTTAPGEAKKRNAKLNKSFNLVATKNIPARREIFTSYGVGFKIRGKNLGVKTVVRNAGVKTIT